MNRRQYLLGLLTERQQHKIEERYFARDDMFHAMLAAEDELIEDYIKGRLSRREKKRFESYILAHPQWSQKVTTMKAMLQVLKEDVTAKQRNFFSVVGDTLRDIFSILNRPGRVYALSYAVVFFFILTGSLYLYYNVQSMQSQLSQLERGNKTLRDNDIMLRQRLSEQASRNGQVAEMLEQEQQKRKQLEEQLAAKTPRLFSPSFSLQPGVLRGVESHKRLVFPSSAETVQLQLLADVELDYRFYSIVIKTVSGGEVWSKTYISADEVEQQNVVNLNVPTALFAYDDYLLTLSGVTAAGETETIHSYFFSVIPR
ncbi:hypothetical protein EH223_16790 [candidate division KSB1 bacterium]|nr:hypothetical protein [candidate division KSB1 bacterium]RQW01003.1 MAG: hypothetical protein EH223_16790 [candidate division KSB1 bacterium]